MINNIKMGISLLAPMTVIPEGFGSVIYDKDGMKINTRSILGCRFTLNEVVSLLVKIVLFNVRIIYFCIL